MNLKTKVLPVVFLVSLSSGFWLGQVRAEDAPIPPAPGVFIEEETQPDKAPAAKASASKASDSNRVKITGTYRLAGGYRHGEGVINDANANLNQFELQGPQSDYIFGERQNNTYDPAIYSQQVVNVELSPTDQWNIYGQVVNDPWSLTGTTGTQFQTSAPNPAINMRYNLLYFGAPDATIRQVYRNNIGDRYNFPAIDVHDGQLKPQVVEGFDDFDGVPGNGRGIPFNIPARDVNFEYQPIRKLWVDYKQDQWKLRLFALADESQALTTDDPLGLSNHKDYWQQSPWLDQYVPVQYFSDRSLKRGYYSDAISFNARDSDGNRLVLLKGVAYEGNFGQTSLNATVAAPQSPWESKYFEPNNVSTVVRLKHQATDKLMLGGTYVLRTGLVGTSVADVRQIESMDTEYHVNGNDVLKAQIALSNADLDKLTNESINQERNGYAFTLAGERSVPNQHNGRSTFELSYTQMDENFLPLLSKYFNTRDDQFWANRINFDDRPDLEATRLGDGIDINRAVLRFQWKEKRFSDKFYNLFDARNVHKTKNTAYVETVVRDEVTVKVTRKLTARGLFRWRGVPATTFGVEPTYTGYYNPDDDIDLTNFTVQNVSVLADKDADQFTYSAGLSYDLTPTVKLEGIGEVSNAIPDFPRGLLHDFFRNTNERVDGILEDRVQLFLYDQRQLGAAPPYDYFTVWKERVVYRPQENLKITLHATQNSYKFAGGLDDTINHQGVSAAFMYSKKLSFFADYTHSMQIDVPKFVASSFANKSFDSHHNLYFSVDYRIDKSKLLTAEYGVYGIGANGLRQNSYSPSSFTLPTIDTEHLLRLYLTGEF